MLSKLFTMRFFFFFHLMLTTLLRWNCYHVHFTDEDTKSGSLGKVAKVTIAQKVVEKLRAGPNVRFLALHWPEPPQGLAASAASPALALGPRKHWWD